jgi:two-component system C4-dicarboxylate transport response regulator DctD
MASKLIIRHDIGFSPRPTKVLLVDEEAGDLGMLCQALKGQGCEVFTCATYEAGIQCLETEPFDLVVVSQGTQAFEGRGVLDRAQQLDRHRPVLVLARCIDMPCYLEAMQMGASDYLEKPVSPAELLQFVRAHTASGEFNIH